MNSLSLKKVELENARELLKEIFLSYRTGQSCPIQSCQSNYYQCLQCLLVVSLYGLISFTALKVTSNDNIKPDYYLKNQFMIVFEDTEVV